METLNKEAFQANLKYQLKLLTPFIGKQVLFVQEFGQYPVKQLLLGIDYDKGLCLLEYKNVVCPLFPNGKEAVEVPYREYEFRTVSCSGSDVAFNKLKNLEIKRALIRKAFEQALADADKEEMAIRDEFAQAHGFKENDLVECHIPATEDPSISLNVKEHTVRGYFKGMTLRLSSKGMISLSPVLHEKLPSGKISKRPLCNFSLFDSFKKVEVSK